MDKVINKEKTYVCVFEKHLFKPILEVIKSCMNSFACEADYEKESLDGGITYVIAEFVDYGGVMGQAPLTIEQIFQRLPIIFLREENSNYIFAKQRGETRAEMFVENGYTDICRDEEFIYSLMPTNERYGRLVAAAASSWDCEMSFQNIYLSDKPLTNGTKELFSEEIEFELEDKSYNMRYCVEGTLTINAKDFILCFLP